MPPDNLLAAGRIQTGQEAWIGAVSPALSILQLMVEGFPAMQPSTQSEANTAWWRELLHVVDDYAYKFLDIITPGNTIQETFTVYRKADGFPAYTYYTPLLPVPLAWDAFDRPILLVARFQKTHKSGQSIIYCCWISSLKQSTSPPTSLWTCPLGIQLSECLTNVLPYLLNYTMGWEETSTDNEWHCLMTQNGTFSPQEDMKWKIKRVKLF